MLEGRGRAMEKMQGHAHAGEERRAPWMEAAAAPTRARNRSCFFLLSRERNGSQPQAQAEST